ncbi:MAG: DUF6125 family protein, partial [Desulfarculaceae bacterium]
LVQFLLEAFHRTVIHYGLWFRETEYQMGLKSAMQVDDKVFSTSLGIQMKRMAKLLGFEVDEKGVPLRIKQMSPEELKELIKSQTVNWLANDGVWFQTVENMENMNTAKRLNDTCWTHYSPYEAERIKIFLGLGDNSGLAGLKTALNFRNYARVNLQSIHEISENSFEFQMNDCRVQSARKRKGLPDYPCLSVGEVEYSYFARSIDSRIVTECVGCPPGDHPEEWYCAWRFTLKE